MGEEAPSVSLSYIFGNQFFFGGGRGGSSTELNYDLYYTGGKVCRCLCEVFGSNLGSYLFKKKSSLFKKNLSNGFSTAVKNFFQYDCSWANKHTLYVRLERCVCVCQYEGIWPKDHFETVDTIDRHHVMCITPYKCRCHLGSNIILEVQRVLVAFG